MRSDERLSGPQHGHLAFEISSYRINRWQKPLDTAFTWIAIPVLAVLVPDEIVKPPRFTVTPADATLMPAA
jgi:hypothetical protein